MRGLLLLLCAAVSLAAQTIEQAETLWKQQRYDDANNAFRALEKAYPKNPDYKVRWGRLLLERFNPGEAADLFREALEIKKDHAGALLGLALVASGGFESRAVELAHQALAADPKLLEAQELLARLALEDGDEKRAIEEADRAIAMSPKALDAMAIRATIDWMDDRAETPWIGKILQQDPHYGRAYETAGHFFVINRRYEEGIAFYRRAIAIQPDLWSARAELGMNLMRLGEEAEARRQLEQCYEAHYRNAVVRNTLVLMDSYKNYVTFKTDRTILRLEKKEAEVLRPYFQEELERALRTYDQKYKIKLDRPVQLEVYPNHPDFEVRTLGLPGLGALGVTFGYIVAMDSPSARKPGSFHWASTMWHELSHVYVLAATKHRVPRWFTEGMAVHEETAVSPEWGDRLDPEAILAIKNKKLLPVAELDRGFVRPSYPSQVVVSYFQAGKICDYIKTKWGYDKLLAMMYDFANGQDTPAVIQKELGLKPEDFDKEFLASLDTQTRHQVEGFGSWQKKMRQVAELSRARKFDDVIREGVAVRDLYPDYVEGGNAYQFLADAYTEKGNKPAAIAELERYAKMGGRNPATLKQLAALQAEAGNKKAAAAALERLNFIFPLDSDLHQKLGDLWLDQGNVAGAIREYQAVVAGKPLDPAASHFNLAKAYRMANRNGEAKDELLLALEAAPGFRPAQKLLLELSK